MKVASSLSFVSLLIFSSCLASEWSFWPKEVKKEEYTRLGPFEKPFEGLGEAIAHVGLSIASCIGQLKPLECLTTVIQQAKERNDPTLTYLLDQPALLYESKDELNDSLMCGIPFPKISFAAEKTIGEWLIKFSELSTSFYDLFSKFCPNDPSPLIKRSYPSFELQAIIGVIGTKARMDPSLTKYMGIAHAVLYSIKKSKRDQPKNDRVQLEYVDSIVAYLGGGEREGVSFEQISSNAWSSLMMDIQEGYYLNFPNRIRTRKNNTQSPNQVQVEQIKKMVDQYPGAHWQNSLGFWLFERVIVIPKLVNYLNNSLKQSALERPTEDMTITKRKDSNWALSPSGIAMLLYFNQPGLDEITDFLTLMYQQSPSFDSKLIRSRMGNVLMYSSLFYAIPDEAKQRWLWKFLERANLLEDEMNEKNKVEEDLKQDDISNYPWHDRANMYRQVAKAYGQDPNLNIISFLKLIDEKTIEVISNNASPNTPLPNLVWTFDINGLWLRLDTAQSAFERRTLNLSDLSQNDSEEEDNDFIFSDFPSDDESLQYSSDTKLIKESESQGKDGNKEFKEFKEKTLSIAVCDDCRYEVFIFRSNAFYRTITPNYRAKLISGDLVIISSARRIKRLRVISRLDSAARNDYSIRNILMRTVSNKYILPYELLTTSEIAIRIL